MRPKVALMRAMDDAERSADALANAGFEAVLAPVLAMRALESATPPGPFDAVIVTSARALEFAGPAALTEAMSSPLFGVGERAQVEASARGIAFAAAPAPDAASLAGDLFARLPAGAHVLYLAGRDRKRDLEMALGASGVHVAAMEVYEAEAREAWSAAEIEGLQQCVAALHYSRRSSELATRLAVKSGLAERWRALRHVAISGEAAEPLLAFGANRVFVASAPREREMIAELQVAVSR